MGASRAAEVGGGGVSCSCRRAVARVSFFRCPSGPKRSTCVSAACVRTVRTMLEVLKPLHTAYCDAKPVKRQTHCFAPGCSTGYVSARKAGVKRSVFTVPNDEDRLKAWQRSVPRGDKLLDRTAVLWELHFEQRFVRDYTHIVNGEVVKIPRGRPCLTDDAIPSIFPNTPSYLSKKLPQKRSCRTSRGEVLGKKKIKKK